MSKPRILSGMRPTGRLHIGHYFGTLVNWVGLQDPYECFYMVADWHALMSEYKDPRDLLEFSYDNVADWIACGIDPARSVIFRQSDVSEHAELHLILSAYVPLPWLERVPTYKEAMKEVTDRDLTNYAFLGYPVLQAADILLYKAKVVPVGEDQLPHLELTREIVRRVNHLLGREILVEPFAKLTPTPRILGTDGRKMSKSYKNAINLSDDEKTVREKARGMFTDPARVRRQDPGHPDACPVFSHHNLFNRPRVPDIHRDCSSAKIGCVECKGENADRIAAFLQPIQEKRRELLKDRKKLAEIVEEGNKKARAVARQTLEELKAAIFRS